MMKYNILLGVFLMLNSSLNAQFGSIKGTVLDTSSTPIKDVAITLSLVTSDTTMVFQQGVISDTSGTFILKNIKTATYLLEFEHLNYVYHSEKINITSHKKTVSISVVLQEDTQQLNEIVVSGKKIPILQTADKITINVSNNILASGGTPLDLLKQLPTVSVSMDGVVSIRGKSDIQILINGKPSGFAALQGQNFLSQLDLSTIEKIEVVTNPSVIRSTNGAGGIINIITKKNSEHGLKGRINSGFGSDEWHHFSPEMNYRLGSINMFINYTLRNRKRISRNTSVRNQEVAGILETIDQVQNGIRDDLRNTLEFGLDYYISEQKYITLAGNYRNRNKKDLQQRSTTLSDPNGVLERRTGTIQEPETNEGWGFSAQFTSIQSDAKSTTLLLDYVHSVEDEDIFREEIVSSNTPDIIDGIQSFYVDINDRVFLDFEQKKQLKDSTEITYGAQAIYRKIDQTFNALQFNNGSGIYENIPSLMDAFDYQDFISAVYLQSERNFTRWSYEAAIKFELLRNRFTSESTQQSFKDGYFKFFPSVKLTYDMHDHTSTVFSMRKGINRPSPNRLNPFPDLTNAFNISIGNPELQPEVFYNIEVGLHTKIHNTQITTGLFYTLYTDLIERITELRDHGITYRFPVNINNMHHYGLDVNLQIRATKWWSQQLGGLLYNRSYQDDLIETSEKVTYQIKSTSSFTVSDTLEVQLFGSYTAPESTAQGTVQALYFFDTGIAYTFSNKKGKLTLNLSDVFNTLEEGTMLLKDGLQTSARQKLNSQRVYLAFRYTF